MSAARELWAGLRLLDRELVDRDGRMAGCVDDLELAYSEDTGQLYVSAVLSGPGALAQRLGWTRYGGWLRRVHAFVAGEDHDPTRIPFNVVNEIGPSITLGASRADLGTESGERWVREHVIDHIPGSGHAPQ